MGVFQPYLDEVKKNYEERLSVLPKKQKMVLMGKKETINDRLSKIVREWDNSSVESQVNQTKISSVLREFVNLGLTHDEAKAWLKNEPNYPADVFSHEPQNR